MWVTPFFDVQQVPSAWYQQKHEAMISVENYGNENPKLMEEIRLTSWYGKYLIIYRALIQPRSQVV